MFRPIIYCCFFATFAGMVLAKNSLTLMEKYCLDCHDGDSSKGDLDLESVLELPIQKHLGTWESVVRKLKTRQMPPVGKKRPSEEEYQVLVKGLVNDLDAHAAKHPNPGRTDTLRRLNRTEYQNSIRDLLDLQIDAAKLLPADESSHGFDNITVGELSPLLLNRYISAAQKISQLAVGTPTSPTGDTYRPPADLSQEDHVPGLPLGTRGGVLFPYNFPRDGVYEFQVHLTRDRNEQVEGLKGTHQLELLLDRETQQTFTIKPPKNRNNHNDVDAHLKTRIQVSAGQKQVGVTFVKNAFSLIETKRQPYIARYNYHRHPRQSPAVFQVSISGPFESTGTAETPSRQKVFITNPKIEGSEEAAARKILQKLARKAYRRPVMDDEVNRLMNFYYQAAKEGGFDAGIENALSSILVSPSFLFRKEEAPKGTKPGEVYAISDFELASRLSFFLWSSLPDEELLDLAEAGNLQHPKALAAQVRRMLADPKSQSLIDNFANQWLYLRNLASITPNHRLFPDFDDNLRQAFRRETELFFESILQEDRSVLDLLNANYTYLNERLAKHYQIPNIYGPRFRKVSLKPEYQRGGLLRHGSILTVTSYATRTSPVIRGNWILENILGAPAPPPPEDVPPLEENIIDQSLPVRERLSQHRENPACASCHNLMDPVGFAMENYDAIGRWRTHEDGRRLDVSGGLPDGNSFNGVSGLEKALLQRPELFVTTLTEKLMTFALGRGIEPHDAPAIRKIVANAAGEDYKVSSILIGIVNSIPFTQRTAL
jgi:hypothetical protein